MAHIARALRATLSTGKEMHMTTPTRASTAQLDRWGPFREFEELASQMDRLVRSAVVSTAGDEAWVPAADVFEDDTHYEIEIELPGVKREDIDVQLNGNELVVTGEIKERRREGLFRRRTRRVGEFEYRVTLPAPVKRDEVEASLAYGVLRVFVPKADTNRSNKIPVSNGEGTQSETTPSKS
jgi:HSP20 family protein